MKSFDALDQSLANRGTLEAVLGRGRGGVGHCGNPLKPQRTAGDNGEPWEPRMSRSSYADTLGNHVRVMGGCVAMENGDPRRAARGGENPWKGAGGRYSLDSCNSMCHKLAGVGAGADSV